MDASAIADMNKLRASLGMAPLPVPSSAPAAAKPSADAASSDSEDDISTLDARAALAGTNFQRLENERLEKLEREKRKAAAKRARDASQRFARLEGKALGDEDAAEELDTKAWLMQQKKRQRKIEKARKMEEELAERERELQAEYTGKDLAGVKVGHEAEEFEGMGGEQILTLKDQEIGDESEDDELENAELKAKEKLEARLNLKKKKPDYDPTEQGEKVAVLAKYDEEIDGKKGKKFTLDGEGSTVEATRRRAEGGEEKKSKGVTINLDMFEDDGPVNDYLDPAKVKVKKPKKHKEKKSRQKPVDEDDIVHIAPPAPPARVDNEAMEIDGSHANGLNDASSSRKRAFEFDDDDLQAQLAVQRRQALKKRKKTDAAEIARQLRDEMVVDEQEDEEGGLMIDETTEFVANLKRQEDREDSEERKPRLGDAGSSNGDAEDGDGDTAMAGQSYAEVEDEEDRKARTKRETSTPAAEVTTTGLEEEDLMAGQGIAATLNLLRKRGMASDTGSGDVATKDRARMKFLAEKQHLIDEFDNEARVQREAERNSGRWDKMSHRDRDEFARRQNEAREHYLSKLQADMFNKQYRPDVKLQYHDEFGRSMNQKEAFKHLSHQFHGKGSGKQKTEKRLKKVDDEKREMAKGVLNVGEEGGMMNVQGREGKRQKQAGVRLQ
ncbi:hypothetical protein B0A48_02513 [Cryoendolithus antarcticus]|uniref:SART-1 protein n=1 Tax=Cryoendolithus antarcticus TaxID=1507870 RepID=A0A1V8TNU6_9PEZI|nr:hypothetical protein B0A48_02513 [Cryoendolithus antarcticus]